MQGSLSVSTVDLSSKYHGWCFNSIVDFLAVSTIETYRAVPGDLFQFRRGFSGYLDDFECTDCESHTDRFQFRRGFSGYLDPPDTVGYGYATEFQFRRGFSGYLDPSHPADWHEALGVSIPSWIFWLSRLPGIDTVDPEGLQFQFRRGFSGYLDGRAECDVRRGGGVSIPSWIFWLSRQLSQQIGAVFYAFCFNSVVDFLAISTRRSGDDDREDRTVSIPSWIFWLSRPCLKHASAAVRTVSIPSWIFWLSRHARSTTWVKAPSVSIPSWIFWLSRQGVKLRL